MQVIRDDIWLCDDCTIAAVNGDYSGFGSDADIADTEAGLDKLGAHLVPDFDSETGDGMKEFSSHGCDCCERNARLGGSLHRFAVLGD